MGGSRPINVVAGAICLSVTVHIGLAVLAGSVAVAAGQNDSRPGERDVAPMVLAWAEEDPLPEPDPPREPKQPEPPAPQPEPIEQLRLGIAESDQASENWMGFAEPTPHAAAKSDVEQPALDPAAGTPAPIGTPSPAAPTGADTAQAVPPAPIPAPVLPPVTSPPEVSPPGVQPDDARTTEAPPREPIDAGGPDLTDDTTAQPEESGTQQPEVVDPELPLMVEGDTDTPRLAEPLASGFVGPPFEASESEQEAVESAIAAAPQPPPTPPAVPQTNVPPDAAGQPIASPNAGGTSAPGTTPGEQSDRESDGASLEEPVQVRLGRPAAAKGLEIITRRPEFSRVTRLTVYPAINPRLRVTFNREGRVSAASFLDPTGLAEVDSPVLHAVYRWTAKGEALTKLPKDDPKAGVTITVTILLR